MRKRNAAPVANCIEVEMVVHIEESRISSKGQVVIPKYLRDALGLNTGTVVVMYSSDKKLILMKKPQDALANLAAESSKLAMKNIRRDIKPE